MTETETAAAVEAGRLSAHVAHVLEIGNVYAIPTPDGVTQVDLTGSEWKPWRDPRKAICDTVRLDDPDSFFSYWSRHATTESTLFANRDRSTVTAIFDAHVGVNYDADFPATDQAHRAVCMLEHHPTLKTWRAGDGQQSKQDTFVEFVREQRPYIISPDGATLLEMCRDLSASSNASHRAQFDPKTGARTFLYTEAIDAKTINGTVHIPDSFTVRLPVWRSCPDAVEVEAALQVRVAQTGLTIGYRLLNLTEALDEAFAAVVARIQGQTGITVWFGTP